MGPNSLQVRNTINGVDRQTEAINLVVNGQFHRRVDIAFLFVTAHVNVGWILPSISQSMDQRGIAMKIKDDRLVDGKERVKVSVGQTVRMFRIGLQFEEIHHVDETNLQMGELLAQKGRGRKSFLGGDVSSRGEDQIRFPTLIIACPVPDSKAFCAVLNGRIHVQVLQVQLLVAYDHVHVVFAAQTVICHGEKGIGIGRQVNAGHSSALIDHYVEKVWVLMREAVVVLAPYG